MSITFPCYVRVLDSYKAEKKDQMALKKGEFVRVLRSDDQDDNYFGEVLGKSGFFPNYYVEAVTEEDLPKKEREMFRKLDKSKETLAAKEKDREDRLREKSPQPRHRDRDRLDVSAVASGGGSPDLSVSPRSAAQMKSPTPKKNTGLASGGPVLVRGSTRGNRRSGDFNDKLDNLQIEVNSVVLPATPLLSPANRKLSSQPRRLSRVNPKDVKRLYEGPTFGVPLAHQMFIGYEEFVIPPILANTTAFLQDHLTVEGLFRVSGSQDELAEWKASFNVGKPVDFREQKASAHSVAGLLKAWLRELPEPLLTYAMFDKWMVIATKTLVKNQERAIEKIKDNLGHLPPINLAVLRELFRFLAKVVSQSAKNLMTAENVGVVIGPNILATENQDAITSAHVMPAAVTLTAFLVKNADKFFGEDALSSPSGPAATTN